MIAGPPKIRHAEASDLAVVLRIERQTPSASHWSEAEYKRILAAELLLVAETGKAIVGFLCAKQVAGEWTLENIAVAPEWQRQGIARELLTALFVQVRQRAPSTLFLEVRESNLPARRFYEKHGFAEVGRRRRYYQSPVEDAVIYCLHVSTAISEASKPRA